MTATAQPVPSDLPDTSPSELASIIATLHAARRLLAARSTESIIAALDDVIDGWLAPRSAWRARAERELCAATGFSPAMLSYALPTMLQPLRAGALADLLASEVRAPHSPGLILH